MHTVFALLCFVVVIHWLIFPYPSGLLHWHCGNLTIAPVPAKQPWWIWINTSCEFIMNDCITTTKQSTTKPCAYFLGYTVYVSELVAWRAPSHYLNQCWNVINWNLRNKLQWNSYILIQEKAFENIVCEMIVILSRPQCVKCYQYVARMPFQRHSVTAGIKTAISLWPVSHLILSFSRLQIISLVKGTFGDWKKFGSMIASFFLQIPEWLGMR